MATCPVCAGTGFSSIAPSARIAAECRIRERFIHERLRTPVSNDELKDLTDFFHQAKAEVLSCTNCGLLVRHEWEPPAAPSYDQDEYNPDVIERLYPQYRDAFARKEKPYRCLLAPQ